MEENLVKIKIPLPQDDPSDGEAEWVWVEPQADGTFELRNVPIFVYGLSYGDFVKAKSEDGVLVFQGVARRGGHSTYRLYTKSDRKSPEVTHVLQTLEKMHCDMEPATAKIVGVDVLPEADIYGVYGVFEKAERDEILEFDEGHCGHSLKSKS